MIDTITVYKVTPKPGYVFHSLDVDNNVCSDCLYLPTLDNFDQHWEEIPAEMEQEVLDQGVINA